MDMQTYLDEHKISKYRLSQISGVPKTTIIDICAGRSRISKCSAKTIQLLAKALGITMENVMDFESKSEKNTYSNVIPENENYLECGLPPFLQKSIENMKNAWNKIDNDEEYLHWDCDFCELQTDINNAEVNNLISMEQAWYLREKYLRMERNC